MYEFSEICTEFLEKMHRGVFMKLWHNIDKAFYCVLSKADFRILIEKKSYRPLKMPYSEKGHFFTFFDIRPTVVSNGQKLLKRNMKK